MLDYPLVCDFFFSLFGHATGPLHAHTHMDTHRSTKLLEACSAGDTLGRQMPTPNWASSQRDLHCFDRRAEDQGETVKSRGYPLLLPDRSSPHRQPNRR